MYRLLAISALSLFLSGEVAAQTVTFRVPLAGGQVVPSTSSAATGNASVVLDTATRVLSVTGSYSSLETDLTGVHVHGNAGIGANAGQLLGLSSTGGRNGSFSGGAVLSPTQVQNLLNGLNYIDIHTVGHPGGEIRGQIVQSMNEVQPAELTTDPVLADTAGDPDFGPNLNDPAEPFNMSLDCSNAGMPGIYSIVLFLGKNPAPIVTSLGFLWGTGPKVLKCNGAHAQNTVECFASDVVLPYDLALAGIEYCVQGFCGDPTNRPGRLSNAVGQVVGLGPASIYRDAFDGSMLDPSWSLLNASLMQFSVSGGELHIEPNSSLPWFHDDEGPLIYRTVTGDFTATAVLRVEDPNNPGQPPPPPFRLGGLIARDPGSVSGDRNSVHVVLGAGDPSFPIAAEEKTTVASNSTFAFSAIAQPRGEVRIVRRGTRFSLEYRAPGAGSFQILNTHDRTDLPSTLQVGLMAYANSTPPDVIAHFDEVTIVQ